MLLLSEGGRCRLPPPLLKAAAIALTPPVPTAPDAIDFGGLAGFAWGRANFAWGLAGFTAFGGGGGREITGAVGRSHLVSFVLRLQ